MVKKSRFSSSVELIPSLMVASVMVRSLLPPAPLPEGEGEG